MSSMCRTCLTTTGKFSNIFMPASTFLVVADAIMECAPIKISTEDNFSVFICENCLDKLTTAHEFRTMCIQADETLRKEALLRLVIPDIKDEPSTFNVENFTGNENLNLFSSIKIEHENKDVVDVKKVKKTCKINEVSSETNIETDSKVTIKARTRSAKRSRNGISKSFVKTGRIVQTRRCLRLKKSQDCIKVNEVDDIENNSFSNDCEELKQDLDETNIHEDTDFKNNTLVSLEESNDVDTNEDSVDIDTFNSEVKTEDIKHISKRRKDPPVCPLCNKEYKNRTNLQLHILWHTGQKLHECDICNKKLRTKSTLINHKALMHSEGVPRPVNKNLKKRFECELCDFKCTYNCKLKKHMLIHKGERNFMCEFCGKTFSGQGNLIQHRKTHTGERPHSCDVCGKSFMEPCQLRRHVSSVHDKQRPHECSICGKRFALFGSIKPHMRVHTGERTFACDLCDKTFARSSSLRDHRRIHTGEKPYACSVCGRKFTQKPPLNVHMRTQHLIKSSA